MKYLKLLMSLGVMGCSVALMASCLYAASIDNQFVPNNAIYHTVSNKHHSLVTLAYTKPTHVTTRKSLPAKH